MSKLFQKTTGRSNELLGAAIARILLQGHGHRMVHYSQRQEQMEICYYGKPKAKRLSNPLTKIERPFWPWHGILPKTSSLTQTMTASYSST